MSVEAMREEIKEEYLPGIRLAARGNPPSQENLSLFMDSIALIRDRSPEPTDKRIFAEDLLLDLLLGKPVGLVRHLPEDFAILAETLSRKLLLEGEPALRTGAIICPDWGHREERSGRETIIVYEMDKLNAGLPETAKTTIRYLETISKRAERRKIPVRFSAHLAGWEVHREPFLADVNNGISETEAEMLIRASAAITGAKLTALNNPYFSSRVGILTPSDFYDRTAKAVGSLRQNRRKEVTAVFKGRREFHGPSFTMDEAAIELAEACVGWDIAGRNTDLLIVPTSPTIARAALSGGKKAWIQLAHGYRG